MTTTEHQMCAAGMRTRACNTCNTDQALEWQHGWRWQKVTASAGGNKGSAATLLEETKVPRPLF
jgi:hypothetical protein